MADWNTLPRDLVHAIADKLVAVEDHSAFTAVSPYFRSAAGKQPVHLNVSVPPWLLLSCEDEDSGSSSSRSLLSMYKNNTRFVMDLPEIQGRHCWGSAHGWIITLGLDLELHLFNPLSRRRIPLPPHNQLIVDKNFDNEDAKALWMRKRYIDRAILIKRPPPTYSDFDNFLVVTTGSLGDVAVLRPHAKNAWDTLSGLEGGRKSIGYIHDIASCKGQTFVLGVHARLLVCSNIDGPEPPIAEEYVPFDPVEFDGTEKLYLVESCGELLLVQRCIDYLESRSEPPFYTTDAIDVYKLDHKSTKWVEVADLGDQALFVGGCQSISLSPAEAFNCRKNCVYFTDDNVEQFRRHQGGRDMGIFDLGDGTVHPFYGGADTLSLYSPPTWFVPTFNIRA